MMKELSVSKAAHEGLLPANAAKFIYVWFGPGQVHPANWSNAVSAALELYARYLSGGGKPGRILITAMLVP